MILYISLLEVFTKFQLFTKPQKVITITFGVLKTFFDKIIADIKNAEKKKEMRWLIEKSAEKLSSEFKS